MAEENSKKSNWWQITALILTALLIVGLIVVNFVFSENRFVITSSIVFLVCLLVIVVLSKSFDSFSLGFFSLKREVKENKEKINNLEKFVFQSNIMQMNNRTDNKTIVNYPYSPVLDMNSSDKEKEKTLQQEEQRKDEIREKNPSNQRLDREKLATLLLDKYMKQNSLSGALVRKDVKISNKILNTDLISDRPITFKAYLKDAGKELFVDIFFSTSLSFLMYHDRIYVKVMKVFSYNVMQNANAKMVCLIGKPDSEKKVGDFQLESYFSPAIDNKLLEIVYIPYSQEEYDAYVKNSAS